MQLSTISPEPTNSLPKLWWRSLKTSRLLTLSVLFYAALFLGTIALSIIDSRVVTGAPVWIKPMKFAISIALYSGTLVWMLSYVEGKRWLVNLVTVGTAVGFAVETIAIFIQAGRGVRSHFNVATPFDATLFSMMGLFIMVVWVLNLLTAVLLLRQRFDNKPFAWSLRLGLILGLIGAAIGAFMTAPTQSQLAALESGKTVTIIGAHSVGVADGGAGVPFTGWSVEGGDLRVPHFVGLHALQLLPLAGLLINRRWGQRLSQNRRAWLVAATAFAYLGLMGTLVWQALRGQPFIAPDTLTLAALAAVALITLGWATAVVTTAEK